MKFSEISEETYFFPGSYISLYSSVYTCIAIAMTPV